MHKTTFTFRKMANIAGTVLSCLLLGAAAHAQAAQTITMEQIMTSANIDRTDFQLNRERNLRMHQFIRSRLEDGPKQHKPQQRQVNLLVDNSGSYVTGELREAMFFTDRNLTGNRDSLSVGYLHSEGMDAVRSSYNVPLNKKGMQLEFGYTTSSLELKKGFGPSFGAKGHGYEASVGLKQSLITNAKTRQELTLDLSRQKSVTYFKYLPATKLYERNIVDDTALGVKLGFSQTDFGASHGFYQRHSFEIGEIKDVNSTKQNYQIYNLNAYYQKAYQHGQQLSAHFDSQYSFTKNIRTQRRYFIGGPFSVRGYKQNQLYGDGGIAASVEYSVPLGDKRTYAYIFTDYGTMQSHNVPNTTLWSYGFGVRSKLTERISMNVALGIPIKDDIDPSLNTFQDVKSGRLHFSLVGTF